MMKGDIFAGRVRGVSTGGLGVVDAPDGRVFFVPATWAGDVGRFQITDSKKRYGFAHLVELSEPSKDRLTPPCPHHGFGGRQCGGCPWQFVSYEAQLEAKQDSVRHALSKNKIEVGDLKPIWPSPKVFAYRNRAQLKTDGKILGFVAAASTQIAPVDDCLVLTEKNRETLKGLLGRLPEESWRPRRGSQWNSIDIDHDVSATEVQLNRRRPFRQANDEQNSAMKSWLSQKLDRLSKDLHVLELFAGSGNFTETISSLGFASVCASEVLDDALLALKARNLPGVQTVAADLFHDAAYPRIKRVFPRAEVLVLDPPRDGLKQKAGLLESYPELQAIGMISCDVATFVRDLADFQDAGFAVVEVQALDQVPHTPHVEIMAWLERA